MRLNASKNLFQDNTLIILKDEEWLTKQRVAGKIAAGALLLLETEVKKGTTKTLLELDKLAETYIRDNGATPTFLNYKGFPNSVCISVNKQLVHGIPSDYQLKDGDIVSFDLGATVDGAIADTAITRIFGQPKSDLHVKLLKITEECLMKGIEAIQVGKRLGVIGNAIYRHAKNNGFNVIEQYGGHGIDMTKDGIGIPHAAPFVSNKADINEGIRIQPGLVIAIEPMAVAGDTTTYTDQDGWTVWCVANASSHEEHTVFVHENFVEIISWRENDETHLPTNKIYFK